MTESYVNFTFRVVYSEYDIWSLIDVEAGVDLLGFIDLRSQFLSTEWVLQPAQFIDDFISHLFIVAGLYASLGLPAF